ncbi:MAG: B12-binding domain-containing radical SAM protein [Theionarchaea archaeon]|nr:MAG: hypothetical protein AYK18_14405 [Theionarchaea archaeon DG-70]MBU7010025.1 B12-binding domain-containing radical SAM protein [Theionarchaea archaeon]
MKIVLADLKLCDPLVDPFRVVSQNYHGINFLAAGYLKSVIEKDSMTKKADVEILIKESLLHNLEMLKREIVTRGPNLIGFSVYVWNYYRTLKLCELIKKELPETKIVLGGPQVSFTADAILEEFPSVDGIVRGEGEIVFLELVRSMMQKKQFGKGILGLTYRNGNKIISNPPRPLLDDINEIPSPYLTGTLDMSFFPKLELETSRGCPFHCAYCVSCQIYNKIRFFNEKRVIEELKLATDYGIENVMFYDSTFNLPQIVYNLCKKIAEEKKIKISFNAFLRPELINKKMLDILERAGMSLVEIGIQSFNSKTLQLIHRTADIEKIKETFKLLHRRDHHTVCDLILGLPGETLDTMKEGINLAYTFEGVIVGIFLLQVLPGSLLWTNNQEFGLEFMKNPPHFVISAPTFSREELAESIRYGYSRYFKVMPRKLAKMVIEGKKVPRHHSLIFNPIFGG